ncbi:uncharacterized protein LAESUDRAFT_426322 [Laetiporus sulphureus 93-53]|uniref:Uncharacterized protein n=1 Tax=Laetiporus sulphureus 93-53 TaxID=1314785 RepID=A0A165GK17_9APHY|nr:uncharacterized protein LAESUDRAFT_426322 [Laetiporus sulphureus 93-53]KZT10459.1 hypothetical protein LAESUDRAFT_426322 [Laetiporus sulphureus 93-53]
MALKLLRILRYPVTMSVRSTSSARHFVLLVDQGTLLTMECAFVLLASWRFVLDAMTIMLPARPVLRRPFLANATPSVAVFGRLNSAIIARFACLLEAARPLGSDIKFGRLPDVTAPVTSDRGFLRSSIMETGVLTSTTKNSSIFVHYATPERTSEKKPLRSAWFNVT